MKIDRFEDLSAWQEARALVKATFDLVRVDGSWDRDLARQMRRAAVSVMANIAEGFSRYSMKDSKQFYVIARGSLAELRSHLYVAIDQGYMKEDQIEMFQKQLGVSGRLLSGLLRNSRRQLDASVWEAAEPMNH